MDLEAGIPEDLLLNRKKKKEYPDELVASVSPWSMAPAGPVFFCDKPVDERKPKVVFILTVPASSFLHPPDVFYQVLGCHIIDQRAFQR